MDQQGDKEGERGNMPEENEELRRRNAGLEARIADLERKNASLEQDLRPFQVLVDNIPDHVYFKDKDSRFLWANRNMLKVRGLKERGEMIGRTDFDIHPRDRAQTSFQDEQRIVRTGEYLLNKLESDVDGAGQPIWMLTTKIPLRDPAGNIIGTCGISKDVTPQIQGEQAMARENALRDNLLENIPDSVYFKDLESRFTWVNRAKLGHLGKASKEEILGRSDRDFFSEERARETREDELRILATGEAIINKLERDNYPDGSPRWVYTTKMPLYDSGGKPAGICGITKDITQLMKAEEVVARESALFNDLLENAPDIVYFKDLESRFTWVNRAMVNLLGVASKAEVIGRTDRDFFNEAHARVAREDELRIMAADAPIVNKLEQDNYADGSPRWIYSTKMAVHDGAGSIVGTCGISKDITQLKKAEEALALESRLLNALMVNIPDAIYFKDMESRFVRVSVNCHLEGMRGTADAIGKTDFDFFSKEHAGDSFKDEQEIIRTGVPLIDKVEKETFTNDRPEAWVSTTKVPIYDEEGRVTGLVGISRDVTERMFAQEAIRKAKDELEVRVQERTSALVQEIKEHLKTEKALREGERLLQESNQRLESRVSQLNFLNSTAHRLAHFTHRKDLLPAILETFTRSFPGVEASLCEMGEKGYRCVAATAALERSETRAACELALADLGQAHLFAPLLVSDRNHDPGLAGIEWMGLEAYPVYFAMPLQVEDRCLAVLQLHAGRDFLAWYDQEKVILNTLAAQAAVSLSNANNFHELDKKARLAGELEVAQSIQRRFTPQDKPSIPRINLKGVYHPAYEVGGDYLDYFQTDSGNWVVVIADVSGKGIPAALVMTMLRSTFRAEARYESSAKKLMCAVNDLMIDDLDDKSFVTALCLIIDKEGRSMSYARAGHPPLLLQRSDNGGRPEPMNPKGLALGMVAGEMFVERMEEMTLLLDHGNRYLIFTDGLLEAMDPDRETYGIQRLLKMLSQDSRQEPEKVLSHILDDVRVFIRSEPYHDDLTMLAMEVTG